MVFILALISNEAIVTYMLTLSVSRGALNEMVHLDSEIKHFFFLCCGIC